MLKTCSALISIFAVTVLFAMPRAQAADGKQLFQENKCTECHSIEKQKVECTKKGDKGKGPDLSDVGTKHDAAWMKKFLMKEVETKDGKKHKKKWGGSDADLDTLINWLASLNG